MKYWSVVVWGTLVILIAKSKITNQIYFWNNDLILSPCLFQSKPDAFDRGFASNTSQEQVYNACAQRIVKGESSLPLFIPSTYLIHGVARFDEDMSYSSLKAHMFLIGCFVYICILRCSGRLQRDDFCIWANILWKNSHHGGMTSFYSQQWTIVALCSCVKPPKWFVILQT